jgi:hypothetical protein
MRPVSRNLLIDERRFYPQSEKVMQRWPYFVLFLSVGCGASHEVGRGAAEGALTGVQKETQHQDGGPPPIENATRNVVRGALAELDTPEGRAELSRILGAATQGALLSATGGGTSPSPEGAANPQAPPGGSPNKASWGGGPLSTSLQGGGGPMAALGGSLSEGFAHGLSKQLQSEIGPDGKGPLAKTFSVLVQQMSGAAATGVGQSVLADGIGCTEADRSLCAQARVQDLSRSLGAGFAQGFAAAMRVPILLCAFAAGVISTMILLALIRLARPRARSSERAI